MKNENSATTIPMTKSSNPLEKSVNKNIKTNITPTIIPKKLAKDAITEPVSSKYLFLTSSVK